ncbi:uncharacterized protein AB675_8169 [Cyphellophora attinorum]|uniref:Biotrophy-associated secreted protein 2 n=1 Tax=Cyphellophora attinorum TaxID=1664694 RepID=A0A0N0NN85_9EURO|nr:uncharacterized protein AB675_8169 [Phialophora attinorum]KPI41331.1 hypothetical protein AB675_8169 [Phialophora attinorum]
MVHFSAVLLFSTLTALVAAQGTGTQFITGPCTSDADCASGCCGFNSGKCAGAIIALERDGGCGRGATPNDNAARKLGFTGTFNPGSGSGANAAAPASTGTASAANPATGGGNGATAGAGTQFITGACTSDADCASGCCGFNSGKCAGAIVALERDGGCGRGSGTPNDNAARKLGFTGTFNPGSGSGAAANNAAAGGVATGNSNTGMATGNANTGTGAAGNGAAAGGNGAQFITGPCQSDAACASGCCGFNSGKCAGPVIAQERDGGCGFGDNAPNDRAAQAFRAGQKRGLEFEWE